VDDGPDEAANDRSASKRVRKRGSPFRLTNAMPRVSDDREPLKECAINGTARLWSLIDDEGGPLICQLQRRTPDIASTGDTLK
jgi:hypothetical protein